MQKKTERMSWPLSYDFFTDEETLLSVTIWDTLRMLGFSRKVISAASLVEESLDEKPQLASETVQSLVNELDRVSLNSGDSRPTR